MDGIICINKPEGFTSFDVVAKLRGMTKIKKIGHSGTLDPMATGVLPVFIGRATRAIDLMPDHRKRYTASFQLGQTTDTLDRTGTILSSCPSQISLEGLKETLSQFQGIISQFPPMYSAVKVNGQRLYDLARQGKEIERKPRQVEIYGLNLLEFSPEEQIGKIDVFCSKGTYIRSLCDDVGKKLGVGAVLTDLVRTQAGCFCLEDCFTLEQIQKMKDQETLEKALISVERLFSKFPKIQLNPIQTRMFSNGVKLDLKRIHWQQSIEEQAVYGAQDEFLGIAIPNMETSELVIRKLLI